MDLVTNGTLPKFPRVKKCHLSNPEQYREAAEVLDVRTREKNREVIVAQYNAHFPLSYMEDTNIGSMYIIFSSR